MQLPKLLGIFICFLCVSNIYAQVDYDEVKPVSNTYFIDSINVYSHDQGVMENMQILIKNGIIQDLGSSIIKPYDAIQIKGDSMFAYPAFIDALSHTGLKKEEEKKEKIKVRFPGKPGDLIAGVTPYKSIDSDFNKGDKSLENYRKAGYAVSHVVPKGKMLPGKGSLVLLKSDKEGNPYLKKDISTFAQFEPASGVFPSTVIGVISRFKELHRSTDYKLKHREAFDNATGVQRPQFSKAEEAFSSVVNGSENLYFKANNHKDISRAIKLKDELGFNLILADVQQAWLANEKIKAGNIPVILSLKLPEEMKEEKVDSTKEISAEKEGLQARQKKSYTDYMNQALSFEKANMPFSFSSISVKANDIKKSLKRIVDTGVKESTVFSALTENPAKLLGIDNLTGSLERGKLANLIICTKSFFDEASKIKYCFVEGEKSEFDTSEKKKKKSSGESQEIAGTWTFESNIMGMNQAGNIIISGNKEDGYKVKVESNEDPGEFEDGKDINYDANELSFSMTVESEGGNLPITFTMSFDGEDYTGKLSVGDFGSFPVEGSRTKKPE